MTGSETELDALEYQPGSSSYAINYKKKYQLTVYNIPRRMIMYNYLHDLQYFHKKTHGFSGRHGSKLVPTASIITTFNNILDKMRLGTQLCILLV